MNAIIQKEYGGVDKLTLEEVEKPLISKNQILVEIGSNVSIGDNCSIGSNSITTYTYL